MTTERAAKAWGSVMALHSATPLAWGPTNVDRFLLDPKRMAFFHSRYKFAAKMLQSCQSILDVGCGDGSGTLTFLSDTKAAVLGLDGEQSLIDFAVDQLSPVVARVRDDAWRMEFVCRDFLTSPYVNYDGLCCLDVIEHIDPKQSAEFIDGLARATVPYGVAVVGTPSLASAEYGSAHSKIGHINLYDARRLRAELEQSFRCVLMFSMNDEVVHTGFDKLAHYYLAVAIK